MAQKVEVVLIDDLDGSAAEETVAFSLDNVTYEIDLSAENAAALRDAVAPYLAHARRVRSAGRRSSRPVPTGTSDTASIRAWAREQGMTVNDRGRLSAEVRAAYESAHG